MDVLRREDLEAIAEQVHDDWEYEHPGIECPHNMELDFSSIEESELIFEIQVTRHLPKEA